MVTEVILEKKNITPMKKDTKIPKVILEGNKFHGKKIAINYHKTCDCKSNHINCMTAKEWMQSQVGVWEFYYTKGDIRDKKIHPATFPITLAKKVIELFTHEGELVIDPFVGSGTTLAGAQECNRNAVGFDLHESYIKLSGQRIDNEKLIESSTQVAVQDDARKITDYIDDETVSLIFTSPPYANLLNRNRKNKSRRFRKNEQYGKIEQYSQDERDLGILELEPYTKEIGETFQKYGLSIGETT